MLADRPIDLQLDVIASILALGIVGTSVAYLLNYRLIQDEGARTASTVTYLLPIIAVIFGEPMTWNLFAVAVAVLVAIGVTHERFRVVERSHA